MAEENVKVTKGKESGMTVEEIAEKINSLDKERREYITKLLSEELKAEQLKHQLQRQANREYRGCVANVLKTVAVSRTNEVTVEQLDCINGVNGTDNQIGREAFAILCNHRSGL